MVNVLVVDDDRELLGLVAGVLKREKFEVAVAANAQECLDHLAKTKPSLILMDVMMPDTDGADLVRMIRRRRDLDSARIIFMTGLADAGQSQVIAVDRMNYRCLAKPFSVAQLIKTVRLATDTGEKKG
jgi:DNA-binding response OmpR family regulator